MGKKYAVSIAALEQGGPLINHAADEGIKSYQIPFKTYFLPTYIFHIYKYLKKLKPNVIILFGLKLRIVALPIVWLLKVPVRIVAVRGVDSWKNSFLLRIEKMLSRFATHWVANSKAALKHVLNNEGAQHQYSTVIYNGLTPPTEKPNFNFIQKKSIKIAVVANLKPGKGHIFFIKVLKKLSMQEPNYYAEFIGADYYNGYIEKYIMDEGQTDYIKCSGFCNNVPHYLKQFDLFVLPSFSESLPTSIIEAMQAGVPVIASDVGGVAELIKNNETGILCKMGDVEAFAHAIKTLNENVPLRKQLAQTAFSESIERFSVNKAAEAYLDLFIDALKPRK